jgi:cell division protease FtsH
VTTGASNDLQRASKIARKIMTEYGMSSLGPIIFGEKEHEVFLGRDLMHTRNYSEEVAAKIDEQVRIIIEKAHKRCETLLQQNMEKLKEIAKALLQKETLIRKEFTAFFEPAKIDKTKKTIK